MASNDATNALLSIDRTLKAILQELRNGSRSSGAAPADVADDRDLDGKWGDPEVKFNPRDWNGSSCKGFRMSECPAEFLDLLASTFDYFARKADESGETTAAGKPVAPYKRKDAARARGWAKRIRSGRKPPQLDGGSYEGSAGSGADGFGADSFETPGMIEDDIPF